MGHQSQANSLKPPLEHERFRGSGLGSQHTQEQRHYREAGILATLQTKTGLSYASVEEFVPWLENPQNTRVEDWEKAYVMIGNLCIDNKG